MKIELHHNEDGTYSVLWTEGGKYVVTAHMSKEQATGIKNYINSWQHANAIKY